MRPTMTSTMTSTMSSDSDQAKALARVLDGDGLTASPELSSLVSLARMIEALPSPTIDAGFADRLEARLAEKIAATARPIHAGPAGVPVGAVGVVIQLEARRKRIRRTLVAAIAAAMMLALPIAASAKARPGSALYGVRLGVESARVWATCRSGAVSCGFAHLDRASARLDDLRVILPEGNASAVTSTSHRLRMDLSAGTTSILHASPPVGTLRRLAARLDVTAHSLESLMDRVPQEARAEMTIALESGDRLSKTVRIAIAQAAPPPPSSSLTPPVAIGPAIKLTRPPPPPANKNQQAQQKPKSTQKPKRSGGKFGVGGTPIGKKPPHGEAWSSDDTVDTCPVGVIAAPGVDMACKAVGG